MALVPLFPSVRHPSRGPASGCEACGVRSWTRLLADEARGILRAPGPLPCALGWGASLVLCLLLWSGGSTRGYDCKAIQPPGRGPMRAIPPSK